jgi:hypothetical protein
MRDDWTADGEATAAVEPNDWLVVPEASDAVAPPADPPAKPAAAGTATAVVLVHPGPFLVTSPLWDKPVKFWPLVRVDVTPEQAAYLLDPETHKAVRALWREWQEGDEPTAETLAAMERVRRMAAGKRRCCGK